LTRNVEIVRTGEIDEGIVELGRTAFGKSRKLYRDYLEWKYLHNPYRQDPLLYVARDRRGRAIAMRGFYGARWSTPAGVVDIPCADDFAVAKEHRRSGIAAELMRYALADLTGRGVQHVVNASGGQVTVLQSLASGWKSIVMVDPLDRPVPPSRLGETWAYVRAAGRPHHRALSSRDGSEGVTASPDPDALAELSSASSGGGAVQHVRDAAFFRWRYANPQREYRFLVFESEGRVTGYLVIGSQRPRADTLPLYFADWEGESDAIRHGLLERGVELYGSSTIRVWAGSARRETRSYLEQLGFEPTQHELRARGLPCVLFRALDGHDAEETETLERAPWDIRLIDSMHG
jgi:GNAT superfamily N-acetyltransferase